MERLFLRTKQVRTVIVRKQRSIRELSSAVVFVELDLLEVIRRKLNRLYPIFINRLIPNLFSMPLSPEKACTALRYPQSRAEPKR